MESFGRLYGFDAAKSDGVKLGFVTMFVWVSVVEMPCDVNCAGTGL